MDIHIHQHCDDPDLSRRLEAILMAISAQTQAVLDRINTATTSLGEDIQGVADKIEALKAQIVDGADAEAINQQLDTLASTLESAAERLDTLASPDDPENPS